MARGWHYTKLSLSRDLLIFLFLYRFCYFSFLFVIFVLFLFCFVFVLSLELCFVRCSSDLFPVQQTTYRIGSTVELYSWVWLRPDRLIMMRRTHATTTTRASYTKGKQEEIWYSHKHEVKQEGQKKWFKLPKLCRKRVKR